MKALVIGGSGFLGGHVTDELIRKGYETSVFDMRVAPFIDSDKVRYYVGSMGDTSLLEEAIREQDYVFLFAGIADIKEAHEDPSKTIEVNVLYLTRILEL